MSDSQIIIGLQVVRARIQDACQRAGRNPASLRLIGVSKRKPFEAVIRAMDNGLIDFGENYVQEFKDKQEHLAQIDYRPVWHFIGQLQTRKVKYLNNRVHWIHSIDRERLVLEIERRFDSPVNCLIEVNLGAEEGKGGVLPDQLNELALLTVRQQKIRFRGLMCVPPAVQGPEEVRPYFRELSNLLIDMKSFLTEKGVDTTGITELSMGMSNDFEQAIKEGATMIRVGRAIFGERQ